MDEAEAVGILERIQHALAAKMQEYQWPVTFSAGVLFCAEQPHSVDDALRQADDLMYEAKNDGRNRVRFGHYSPNKDTFIDPSRATQFSRLATKVEKENVSDL